MRIDVIIHYNSLTFLYSRHPGVWLLATQVPQQPSALVPDWDLPSFLIKYKTNLQYKNLTSSNVKMTTVEIRGRRFFAPVSLRLFPNGADAAPAGHYMKISHSSTQTTLAYLLYLYYLYTVIFVLNILLFFIFLNGFFLFVCVINIAFIGLNSLSN